MVIFSYISLVLCVQCYFVHIINVANVFYNGVGRSGTAALNLGHFFLASCVYFATNYGWTF